MKRTVTLLALLAALCCLFTVSAGAEAAIVDSGTCGENLTWTLDTAGTLTISGTGAMEEYEQVRDVPWYESRDQVKTAVIENGVTDIGNFAFDNCWSLTSVAIPESVIRIGKYALYGCRSLTSVILPVGVTTIGDYAFYNCGSLTDITLPECVTSIGAYAFRGCNLTSVTIPERVTTIGDSAFGGCRSLTSVTFVGSSQLTIIGNAAFVDCSSLTSITIPESVTSIGNFAFCDCSSLTSVTFTGGSQLTTIGNSAFDSCDSLTGITIPEGVTTIGDKAFARCSSLTSITIPEGVTTIGDEVFERCGSLTGITIPASVTSIGEKAFYWCSALTDVSITNMDAWCRIEFENYSSNPTMFCADNIWLNGKKITAVTVPEGVTSLSYTFYGFKDLEQVKLPKSLTYIGIGTFDRCRGLTRVTIPASVTEIDADAFSGCTGLISLRVDEKNAVYDSRNHCNAIIETASNTLIIGCKVTEIPASVTGIGPYAFCEHKNLTSIIIPASVTSIGDQAFVKCSGLTDIYYTGSEDEWNALSIGKGNSLLNNAVIHYNYRLPVTGGTEDFRLEGISVRTAAGEELQELPQGSLLVTVAVRHLNESGSGTILLAQYDSLGRYRGLMWLTLDEMPQGMTLRVTLPVDNSSGEIANLKVFVVEDLTSPLPVGTPVSFGQV